jgi:hypothetical protein
MKDFLITTGLTVSVFALGVAVASYDDQPASAQAPGIHAPKSEQLWELHRETDGPNGGDIYVLDHDLTEDDCEVAAMKLVNPTSGKPIPGEILCVPQRKIMGAPQDVKHSPIPRLVGYGCEGASSTGVIWAAEEDDLPKCEQVLPVGQRPEATIAAK